VHTLICAQLRLQVPETVQIGIFDIQLLVKIKGDKENLSTLHMDKREISPRWS
jgi:hypothetical protein